MHKWFYSWRAKTRILSFSNFSIARTDSSILWTLRTSLGKKTLDISNHDISNISVGRTRLLDPWTIFSRSLELSFLTFRPKIESSKVRTFYSIFWQKKIHHVSFSLFVKCFLEKDDARKAKTTNKSLAEKCKALKDLEHGLSSKDVATKYGVPRNTVSTWVKNKHNLTDSLEKKGMNSSRRNTLCENYENVDKTIYNWFVGKGSQKIPIDDIIIKEKALEFAKSLGLTEFRASDGWLNNWKKRYNLPYLLILNIFTKYL